MDKAEIESKRRELKFLKQEWVKPKQIKKRKVKSG